MMNTLSYNSFVPHLKHLRACGAYKLSTDSPKLHRLFHTIYIFLSLFFMSFYVLQQMIKVYEVRDDAGKVMDTLFLLLANTGCIYKKVVCWIRADKIEDILDIMKGPLFNQGDPAHEKLLTEAIRHAFTFLQAFRYSALSCCLLWVLYPVILYMQGEHVDLPTWLPFDPNMNSRFYFVIIYIWIQTSLLAFCNTGMDAFAAFLLAHTKTQLSILRLDLDNLVMISKKEALSLSEPLKNVLHRRFCTIMLHYNEIISFYKKQQQVFAGAIFYMFVVDAWIICTTVHRMVHVDTASVQFVSLVLYMGCIIAEIYIFCFFGNELNYESEKLIDSAYGVNWLQSPLEHRRQLIIFMEMIKRPLQPKALNIPLTNRTFLSILRSSYSFYAFLKNSSK